MKYEKYGFFLNFVSQLGWIAKLPWAMVCFRDHDLS